MSSLPSLGNCLVCDTVRPELNGKLIILGYFGICPNVVVGIPRLDQPTVLTFVFSGSPGEGAFMASFDIIDEMDERVISSTPPAPLHTNKASMTTLATTFLLAFGHAGTFAIRCFIDDAERFRAQFRIEQGSQ